MYPVASRVRYRPTNKSRDSIDSLSILEASPAVLRDPLATTKGRFFAFTSSKSNICIKVCSSSSSSSAFFFFFSSGGPTILFFQRPKPISSVTGLPFDRSKRKVPNIRQGAPINTSVYVKMTVMSFVDPTRMKVVARANIVPARKVSTVSCKGKTQPKPFCLMKGPTASLKKLSTTQSSRRIRRRPLAMIGPYSTKLSSPTTV
mmetsp:Transcript_27721/g.41246  ORF Transcript_27721/g.41246 Transcript_27721/m.41246 type:complete len:203 (+) Transcript_27721:419-1027(+)